MCTCLFVVLTITVTWLQGDTTFSQPKDLPMPPPLCVLLSPTAVMITAWSYVAAMWLCLTSKLSMETPYSNSSSVKCSYSSCLYIFEYVRTFVLCTLKIKLRSVVLCDMTNLYIAYHDYCSLQYDKLSRYTNCIKSW